MIKLIEIIERSRIRYAMIKTLLIILNISLNFNKSFFCLIFFSYFIFLGKFFADMKLESDWWTGKALFIVLLYYITADNGR
jgi:hypothetical protein